MVTARRLYVYLVSAVALWLVAAGLIGLCRVIVDALGVAPAYEPGTGGRVREDLSLALALTAVGLPLWGAHTWFAERLATRDDAAGADERGSVVRALYLAGAGAVLLLIGGPSAVALIRDAVLVLAAPDRSATAYAAPDIASRLATVVVLLGAYVVLGRFRLRDLGFGPIDGPAAALARLELHAASLAGLLVFIAGLLTLLRLPVDLVLGPAVAGGGTSWQWDQLASGLGQTAVGGAVWLVHRALAARLAGRTDAVGAEERASRMRVAEQVAFLAVAAGFALFAIGGSLGELGTGLVLGTGPDGRAVLDPLLGAAIYLAALVLRRSEARHEAERFGGDARLGPVVRATDLGVAAVGLAFVAVGVERSLAIALDQLGGSAAIVTGAGWTEEMLRSAAYAIAGVPVWVLGWRPELVRAATAPAAAATSTIRRGHLFLVAGLALVSTAGGAAFVIYQGLRTVMALESTAFIGRAADGIGAALVGLAVLAYHALLVRSDNALRAEATAAAGAGEPARGTPSLAVRFVVRGPAAAAADGLAARLAADLPAGWTIEAAEAAREPEPADR